MKKEDGTLEDHMRGTMGDGTLENGGCEAIRSSKRTHIGEAGLVEPPSTRRLAIDEKPSKKLKVVEFVSHQETSVHIVFVNTQTSETCSE